MDDPPEPKAASLRWTIFTGLAFWALGLAGLGALWLVDTEQATACALAVAAFYYSGQFGAIPLGLGLGGEPLLIGLFVLAADAAGLLVFFPITQLGIDRLASRRGFLSRWIMGVQERARRRRQWVETYGAWALFGFTCLPFLFNSPILGAAIGRMAGMRPHKILAALLGAVTLMSAVWTIVFDVALEQARAVDDRLPLVIGAASVALTLVGAAISALVHRLRRRAPSPPGTGRTS